MTDLLSNLTSIGDAEIDMSVTISIVRNLPQPRDERRASSRADDSSILFRTSGRTLREVRQTSGVQSHFQVIDTSEQESVAGVAKAGGTVPFMRMPAHEAGDADVPLESLWGRRRTAALRERLLESASIDATLDALEAVLHEMWRPPGLHPAVNFALGAFDRAPSTTSIAAVTDAIDRTIAAFETMTPWQIQKTHIAR